MAHTLELAEALAGCGQHVTVWAPAPRGVTGFHRTVDNGVGVRVVPVPVGSRDTRSAQVVACLQGLAEAFEPAYYDIVHAQGWVSAGAVGPCLHTVHRVERFGPGDLAQHHRRGLTISTAHVCTSRAVAAELRAGWGISAAVIPEGVDAVRFARAAAPGPAAVAARDGWRRRLGRYVLTVGDAVPAQTAEQVMSALARARAGGLGLVIVDPPRVAPGRPRHTAWLRASAASGVPFARPAVGGDVAALIAGASAFVLPSGTEWPHPAALQALAADVPLLTFGTDPCPTVLDAVAAHAADVQELAAALDEAIQAPDGQRLQAGRALAAERSWVASASEHLDLYRATMKASTGNRTRPAT
ncbi:MAG TPA: glycosyltransferase [Sporichthyaceae bacterium]|nr:glycosyltransferase [Sporichthyaceae bacterium]